MTHNNKARPLHTREAYENLLFDTDKPWCWACGRSERGRPDWWHGPWRLERAHLAAGSGTMRRIESRRAVNILCCLCHSLHTHRGGTTRRVNGHKFRTLSDANMLWIKRERDTSYWHRYWLAKQWVGELPERIEPVWLRDDYYLRVGDIARWLTNPVDEDAASRYVRAEAEKMRRASLANGSRGNQSRKR